MTPDVPAASTPSESDNAAALRTILRLNAHVLGITLGILGGFGLFLATMILVIKGGPDPGAHLKLLAQFFYGYKITIGGSLLGGVYGFIVGYVAGGIIAVIYNWVDYLRAR